MTFETWKKALFDGIATIGFRATARKYGLALSSLSNIVKQDAEGDKLAGLQTWKHSEKKNNG